MDIYNFVREKYNEQQRTGSSSIKFPELKSLNKNVELKKGNVKIYSCGHPIKSVIINTTPETLYLYSEWAVNNPCDFCLDCWIKNRDKIKYDKVNQR